MNENLNESVNNTVQETEEITPVKKTEQTPKEQVVKEDHSAAESWNKLNQSRKRDAEEAERLRKENEYLRQQFEAQQKKTNPYDMSQLTNEDLASVGNVKYELQQKDQQIEFLTREAVQNIMYRRYKDFGNVINEKNLKALEKSDPILSRLIETNPNKEEQYELAYAAVKRSSFYKTEEVQEENSRIEDNKLKPRPLSSVSQQSKSPLSQASVWGNSAPSEAQKAEQRKISQAKIKELNQMPR